MNKFNADTAPVEIPPPNAGESEQDYNERVWVSLGEAKRRTKAQQGRKAEVPEFESTRKTERLGNEDMHQEWLILSHTQASQLACGGLLSMGGYPDFKSVPPVWSRIREIAVWTELWRRRCLAFGVVLENAASPQPPWHD